MGHRSYVSRDYLFDIDLIRRKRKRRSTLKCGLTLVAVFAALLYNFLALGMVVGESNVESIAVRLADSVFAQPETLASTSQAPARRRRTANEQANTCRSLECNLTASTILNYMDLKADPCDNFYQFACGGFINSTIIPDDRWMVNQDTIVSDKIAEQLRTMLERGSEPEEHESDRLAKNLYQACANMTSSAWIALRKIYTDFYLFDWPLLHSDQWRYYTKNNLYHASLIDITTGSTNNTSRAIHIGKPNVGFRKFLSKGFDDKFVQTYYSHMIDIAVMLNANKNRAAIELKEVLLLDIEIVKISELNEESISMSVAELTKTYPDVNWKDLFKYLSRRVTNNDTVIVEAPTYISELTELWNLSSRRLKNNYRFWRLIEESAYLLNKEMHRMPVNSTKGVPRWQVCVHKVYTNMYRFVLPMYKRKYMISEEAKTNVRNMFENLKQQLIDDIQQAKWMDDKTQQRAVKKVETMKSDLNYDDEAVDDKKSRTILSVTKSWLEVVQNYVAYCNKNESKELPNWLNITFEEEIERSSYAEISGDYYSDTISVKPGALQGLFFNNDRPGYMNYGVLGFVFGHEMTHMFDTDGRRVYMDDVEVDWMTSSTAEEFSKRTKCLIDQYNNYTDEETGLKLNVTASQKENFSDNGGAKLAYGAYINRAENNTPQQKLPGLEYTPDQMFWISMATSMCAKYDSEYMKQIIKGSMTHLPNGYRIVGSLSNIPEFSKDFSCPMGSTMNPVKKCTVW